MNEIVLVTGGGRSGKSDYALKLAEPYRKRAFVATAVAFDDEMRQRIARHRQERDPTFLTVEEPTDLAGAVRALPADTDVAVIDCLTVWLGNLLHKHGEQDDESLPEITAWLELLTHPPCRLMVVTNEVGMGIIPANEEARRFRDMAGRLNQNVARLADRVVLMVSGIPVNAKGAET